MEGDTPVRLVVGLGNPGREYEDTRHNVGFKVLDRLVGEAGWQWRAPWRCLFQTHGGLLFCKPQTFMNLSGQAVGAVAAFYKVPPSAVLVVLDDLSLDLGRLRIRPSGSAGGHNGLKSVIAALGTDHIPRLRLGIGAAGARDAAEYVLSAFSRGEQPLVDEALGKAVEAVGKISREGLAPAMNAFN
jgi:PTH1 family peptidyl-tRNA hydrolase